MIRIGIVLLVALAIGTPGCDGPESPGNKHEWGILQSLESEHRSEPIVDSLQVTTIDGYEILCVPDADSRGRIWIMLSPRHSPPSYKQMPQGDYKLTKEQVELLVKSHTVSKAVEKVLWSHMR